MPRKCQKTPKTNENMAWEWVKDTLSDKITEENVCTAYRLNLKCCTDCRRNCKSNPRCLIGLGEREWFDDDDQDASYDAVDPSCEKREENSHVGLKNLGNTCYVNSFLQLWFHNILLRRAIFLWKPDYNLSNYECVDRLNSVNDSLEMNPVEPESVMGHLQLLFYLLQTSQKRFIDPEPLIKFLELDTTEQQDAHEFNNLFLNLVKSKLSTQSSPMVKNIVDEQYCGTYNYVTKCQHCQNVSYKSSSFYELDLNIKGHKELSECITEFLKEEKLEGSDQYFCEKCNEKRNATRHISLKHLPPVLNLQLLRFVYDRQMGRKKKINLYLKFPESLDMAPYINSSEHVKYDLTAVLMHASTSADSGHYFSYIKDQSISHWFKYNDQSVEKMEKLKLDSEEEISSEFESGVTKKPKVLKGHHASNSVYMLVYKKQSPDNCLKESDLMVAENVKYAAQLDHEIFLNRVQEFQKMRNENKEKYNNKQAEIRFIFSKLRVNDLSDPYEFIPVEWLTNWLNDKPNLEPIDNSKFLCSHSKLCLDDINMVKCVNSEAVDNLFIAYGGSLRLKNMLCVDCVKQKCKVLRLETQSLKDKKNIYLMLKNPPKDGVKQFWIGKSSLRSWRKIVLSEFSADGESEDSESTALFNDDITCPHNYLSNELDKRRLIPDEVWTIFRNYFPSCSEFSAEDPICSICYNEEVKLQVTKEKNAVLASELKSLFYDLSNNKNRPMWSEKNTDMLHAISEEFIKNLRLFFRDPKRFDVIENIKNRFLLCSHEKLKYPVSYSGTNSVNPPYVLVSSSEWSSLKSKFIIDLEILFHKCPIPKTDEFYISSSPSFCSECFILEEKAVFEKNLNYSSVSIYIRKVLKSEMDAELKKNSSNHSIHKDDSDSNIIPNKKPKLFDSVQLEDNTFGIRRSSRSRKQRWDKEIKVSSMNTVKDLKQKISEAFSILISDQILTRNGVELSPDEATLASLNVTPACIITLLVDDVYCDNNGRNVISSAPSHTIPEVGFRGTKLMESA